MNKEQILKEIQKISKFHKENNIKGIPMTFIRNSFNLAIKCAEKGDPLLFYDEWSYPNSIPKGLRNALQVSEDENEIIKELKNQQSIYSRIMLSQQDDEDDDEKKKSTDEEEEKKIDKKKSIQKEKTIESDSDKTEDEDENNIINSKRSMEAYLSGPIHPLPNFFENLTFYIDSSVENKNIFKYIIAYNGKVHSDLSDKTDFVIVSSDFDEKEKFQKNSKSVIVEDEWISVCHKKQKKITSEAFEI
jgi:hypothetical protein